MHREPPSDDAQHYGVRSDTEVFLDAMKRYRERKGWTQRKLSEEMAMRGLKLDPSAVTRIENGQREPKYREAIVISEALEMPGFKALATAPEADAAMAIFDWLKNYAELLTTGESVVANANSQQIGGSAVARFSELLDSLPRVGFTVTFHPGSLSIPELEIEIGEAQHDTKAS